MGMIRTPISDELSVILIDPVTGRPYSFGKSYARFTINGGEAETIWSAKIISSGNAATISETIVIDGSLYE